LQEDDKPFEVRLSDESFETYELDPPSYALNTTKRELKQMYYDMVAVRYECPDTLHLCMELLLIIYVLQAYGNGSRSPL
jgi:hypothetical protein